MALLEGSREAEMEWYLLVLGCLGVWRVTHLIGVEDGPWAVFARLRAVSGRGVWRRMLDCFHCLSLWVAAPFAIVLAGPWKERMLLWPALSGAAILMERLARGAEPAVYIEDGDPPKE